ncbi:MAG: hypothetical protein MJK15_01785 [Colwellia sp.]|nr:hypothetical protein [Colwellia sp.]
MKVDIKWCDLKKIGDTKFVNSMYMWIFVVPLLVKAFEYVEDEKLIFQIFQQQLPISTSLPFSWSMFYFSAFFLALGNLIYLFKCPKIIKEHPTYQSYVNEGKKLKQLGPYCDDISFNWQTLAEQINHKKERLQLNKMNSIAISSVRKNEPDFDVEDPIHYFWPIHKFGDVKFPFYRRICTTLFIVGFSLFGIVALQNLWTVVSFLMAKT